MTPFHISHAIAAASAAVEALDELLRFGREGAAFAPEPGKVFGISVAEKLAEAARLAIVAQGGPEDADENRFLGAIVNYLDQPHAGLDQPEDGQ